MPSNRIPRNGSNERKVKRRKQKRANKSKGSESFRSLRRICRLVEWT
jgi:hypothetical protein